MHSRDNSFVDAVNTTYAGKIITIGTLLDAGIGDTGLIARHIGVYRADYDTLEAYRAVQIRVFKNPNRRSSNG